MTLQPQGEGTVICRVLIHVAEGPLDERQRGGDEVYRFFRACADWPRIIGLKQTISVEVQPSKAQN